MNLLNSLFFPHFISSFCHTSEFEKTCASKGWAKLCVCTVMMMMMPVMLSEDDLLQLWGRRCLLFLGELEVMPLLLLPKKLAFAKQNSARYWLAMKAQGRQCFYFYFCRHRRCQSSSSFSPLIEFANLINRHNRRVTDAPLLLLLPVLLFLQLSFPFPFSLPQCFSLSFWCA